MPRVTVTTSARLLAAAIVGLALIAVAGAAFAAASWTFTDVSDDHEHAAEIAAAHQINLFNGYGDGTFRPDAKLTQRQAETLIWRILSWHGTDAAGNFEITRADIAVLAMTGLCGLDGDRIPGCVELAPQAVESTRVIETPDPTPGEPDPPLAGPETTTPSTPPSDDPADPDPDPDPDPAPAAPGRGWTDLIIIDTRR